MNILNFNKILNRRFTKSNKTNLQEISKNFWKNKKGNLDSMCGFKELNNEDLKQTEEIINRLNKKEFKKALDVGSGIGRITFNYLYKICDEIDLVDINENFLQVAKEQERKNGGEKIKNYYSKELQKFKFEKSYDLIFVQWVLEYLSDTELKAFIKDVNYNLNEKGVVIIKENVNIDSESCIIYHE
jgi:protein N-terminal methyltransferase